MNYNVMKRPMFRMGGKAASQGTGITSGLDEKVNMTDGRANYANGPTTYQDFLKSALEKQAERDKAIAGMDNLINLQALGRVGQALSTEESSNPLDIIKMKGYVYINENVFPNGRNIVDCISFNKDLNYVQKR